MSSLTTNQPLSKEHDPLGLATTGVGNIRELPQVHDDLIKLAQLQPQVLDQLTSSPLGLRLAIELGERSVCCDNSPSLTTSRRAPHSIAERDALREHHLSEARSLLTTEEARTPHEEQADSARLIKSAIDKLVPDRQFQLLNEAVSRPDLLASDIPAEFRSHLTEVARLRTEVVERLMPFAEQASKKLCQPYESVRGAPISHDDLTRTIWEQLEANLHTFDGKSGVLRFVANLGVSAITALHATEEQENLRRELISENAHDINLQIADISADLRKDLLIRASELPRNERALHPQVDEVLKDVFDITDLSRALGRAGVYQYWAVRGWAFAEPPTAQGASDLLRVDINFFRRFFRNGIRAIQELGRSKLTTSSKEKLEDFAGKIGVLPRSLKAR